jgi:hypothetical protein
MKCRSAIALLAGLGCLVTSACDDGVVTAGRSCSEYCSKLEVCDDSTDSSGCLAICDEQRVRSDTYLSMRATCTDKLSCNVWQGEVGLMGEDICASGERCELNECIERELFARPSTTEQSSYCTRVVNKLNACDRSLQVSTLETHCLDLVPTLSTAYLNEMSGCIEADCAQVVTCLTRAADRYDTALSLYPGSLGIALP